MINIPNGVNCTMLVAYTDDNKIDFEAQKAVIKWYADKGCASLFAMCHSTEMHMLTMQERLDVVACTRECVDGLVSDGYRNMPIIACGTFSDDIHECAEQMKAIKCAGADAVVISTNRLDPHNDGGNVLMSNGDRLISMLPAEFPIGLYECPNPYKRLLKADEMRWATEHNNILFLKDTCCDPAILRERLEIAGNSNLKLFNANSQTLLYSLKSGAAGYSSVMANIHPQLYAWLCENFLRFPERAERLQEILCFCAFAESLSYPLIAKYVMKRDGVQVNINSRMCQSDKFTEYHRHIMEQLISLTESEYMKLIS